MQKSSEQHSYIEGLCIAHIQCPLIAGYFGRQFQHATLGSTIERTMTHLRKQDKHHFCLSFQVAHYAVYLAMASVWSSIGESQTARNDKQNQAFNQHSASVRLSFPRLCFDLEMFISFFLHERHSRLLVVMAMALPVPAAQPVEFKDPKTQRVDGADPCMW